MPIMIIQYFKNHNNTIIMTIQYHDIQYDNIILLPDPSSNLILQGCKFNIITFAKVWHRVFLVIILLCLSLNFSRTTTFVFEVTDYNSLPDPQQGVRPCTYCTCT